MARILKILLPSTFPTLILYRILFVSQQPSSGREVPTAITVRHITSSLIPITLAIYTAECTSKYAPPISPPSPIAIQNISSEILLYFFPKYYAYPFSTAVDSLRQHGKHNKYKQGCQQEARTLPSCLLRIQSHPIKYKSPEIPTIIGISR